MAAARTRRCAENRPQPFNPPPPPRAAGGSGWGELTFRRAAPPRRRTDGDAKP